MCILTDVTLTFGESPTHQTFHHKWKMQSHGTQYKVFTINSFRYPIHNKGIFAHLIKHTSNSNNAYKIGFKENKK